MLKDRHPDPIELPEMWNDPLVSRLLAPHLKATLELVGLFELSVIQSTRIIFLVWGRLPWLRNCMVKILVC